MLTRDTYARYVRLLSPGIAIVVAYGWFGALPQHRELRQTRAEAQEKSAAVEQLRLRVRGLPVAVEPHASAPGALTSLTPGDLAEPHFISVEKSEPTFIQLFAQVLAAFRSRAVSCTSSRPDLGQAEERGGAQIVTLTGDFADVLDSMKAIEADTPHALAAEFSMERAEPTDPCRWQITFRFSEGTE